MTLFMLFVASILAAILVLLQALHAPHTTLSQYELHRRKKLGDRRAEEILEREELLAQTATLRAPLIGIVVAILTTLLIAALGWEKGLLIGVGAALLSPQIAGLGSVKKSAGRIAHTHETTVLGYARNYRSIVRILGGTPPMREHTLTLNSLEELQHLIETSRDILADEDKKLLTRTVDFKKYRVQDVMTAREDIVTIAHDELLGPLVLSDLYKTGHVTFPVVHGDIDHVVGFLDIRSLLTLESELSVVAAQAMTTEVLSVPAGETLHDGARLFLRSGQQLLLVTDDEGAVVGLLSLGDILGVLFGRR